MRISTSIRSLALAAGLIVPAVVAGFAQERQPTREIGRTTEKELNVVLSSSIGTLVFRRGEEEKVLALFARDTESASLTNVDYSIRNRVGYADITLGKSDERGDGESGSFNFDRGSWHLEFSDAIPVSFDVELKAGKGNFNLTGLKVRDFRLSTGASDIMLSFDEPNTTRIDNLTIESGVGQFRSHSLGNANFKRLRFQGGVGSYELDFGGKMPAEVDVDVEVGFGAVTIIVPAEAGARVSYEKSWVSRIDCSEDFSTSGNNQYVSNNYASAGTRMNIKVKADFGNVTVRRP